MVRYDIDEIYVIPTKIIGISAWNNLRNECYLCCDPFHRFLTLYDLTYVFFSNDIFQRLKRIKLEIFADYRYLFNIAWGCYPGALTYKVYCVLKLQLQNRQSEWRTYTNYLEDWKALLSPQASFLKNLAFKLKNISNYEDKRLLGLEIKIDVLKPPSNFSSEYTEEVRRKSINIVQWCPWFYSLVFEDLLKFSLVQSDRRDTKVKEYFFRRMDCWLIYIIIVVCISVKWFPFFLKL